MGVWSSCTMMLPTYLANPAVMEFVHGVHWRLECTGDCLCLISTLRTVLAMLHII